MPLHLTVDPWWELASAIAYGRVDDGLPPRQFVATDDERLAFVLHEPGRGPVIGFVARDPHEIDVAELTTEALWDGPRFDVPALTLTRASTAEILLAIQHRFGPNDATADAVHFHQAMAFKSDSPEDLDAAAVRWRRALEAGQMKALFGLGYTLVEAGRARDAYDALRRYTELTPENAWAWCWLGRACMELGEREEAAIAFRTAIERERGEEFATDASELLEELEEA